MHITCDNGKIEQVQIFDIKGEKLFEEAYINYVEMSDMSTGLYILNVVVNGKPIRYKVIKK